MRDVSSTATFSPHTRDNVISTTPSGKIKAARAARGTLAMLGRSDLGGTLEITSKIPQAKGFGSSSCDVVATIRAVSRALGRELSPDGIAAVAVYAETASDPLMHEESTVLFAQRRGQVVKVLPNLPPLLVLGCDSAPRDKGVTTEYLPLVTYTEAELRTFDRLLDDLSSALDLRDHAAIGRVASTSAEINCRYLPNPLFEPALDVLTACGALGVQVAHSGTLVGLLFVADASATSRTEEAARLLAEHGAHSFRTFVTGNGVVTG